MGRVVHFEIHADEPERAASFYRALFGWEIVKWDGPGEYWLVTTGEDGQRGINGGILRRHGKLDQTVPYPLIGYVCTVQVDDVDVSLAKAQSLGSVIALPKMPIPTVGWLVYVKDSEGNIFGMMQYDPAAK